MRYRFLARAALITMSVAAFGQTSPATNADEDSGFFVRYASNLLAGDSVINITNTGKSSNSSGLALGTAQAGNLCANFYAYTPDEQLIACCSCEVTPNGLKSISVKTDLASNPLTPIIPSDLVVKVLVTEVGGSNTCTNGTAAVAGLGTYALAQGLVAWGTTVHALPTTPVTYGVTETEFHAAKLSGPEAERMRQLCGFIRANGSGYGICKSCRLGGLGASTR
jgi:hypothetical protein